MYYYIIPNLFKYIKISDVIINKKYVSSKNSARNNKNTDNYNYFSKSEICEIKSMFLENELLNNILILSDNDILHDIFKTTELFSNLNNAEKKDLIIIDKLYTNLKLILIDIFSSLILQKNGGSFIVKLHDISDELINDILFIFTGLYDKVYIINSNIENVFHIICKNFSKPNTEIIENIIEYMKSSPDNVEIIKIIDYNLPQFFTYKINECKMILKKLIYENDVWI